VLNLANPFPIGQPFTDKQGNVTAPFVNWANELDTMIKNGIVQVVDFPLSTGLTTLSPGLLGLSRPPFGVVVIILEQPGGGTIAWSSEFLGAATNISTVAGVDSAFLFVPLGNQWLMVATSAGTYASDIKDLQALVSALDIPAAAISGASGTDPVGNVFGNGLLAVLGAVSIPTFGFPGAYSSVALTGQTATIAAVNIQHAAAILPAGRYLVTVTAIVTATGVGNLTVTLAWNDGTAAESITLGPSSMATSPARLMNVSHAVLDGVHNLTYATTVSPTGGTYSLWIDVVRLS
jgi:hypothetical protein